VLETSYFKKTIISLLSIACFSGMSYPVMGSEREEPYIRVLIANQEKVRIRSDNQNLLTVKSDNSPVLRTKGITILRRYNTFLLKTDENDFDWLILKDNHFVIIKTRDKRGIWFNKRRYKGVVNLIPKRNNINVINVIKIESYLSSVVGSEMPHTWPLEALKAQAVASRTYALKQKSKGFYDINATINNQVYLGIESITPRTLMATNETRSLVLVYKNKLISSPFHSSSGGMTESSKEVWNNYFPYLESVKDFDHLNPKFNWEKEINIKELARYFPELGEIKQIKIIKISKSGRISLVEIIGTNDKIILSGNKIRELFKLRSTLVRFNFRKDQLNSSSKQSDFIIIKGLGAGHGVGLSQWGANGMARKGYNYRQILKHFYKGVSIKTFKNSYKY